MVIKEPGDRVKPSLMTSSVEDRSSNHNFYGRETEQLIEAFEVQDPSSRRIINNLENLQQSQDQTLEHSLPHLSDIEHLINCTDEPQIRQGPI
jgi:hypothetical protein